MMACGRLPGGLFSMRLSFFLRVGFFSFCSIRWTSCLPCEPNPLISFTSTSAMSMLRTRLFLVPPPAGASAKLLRSTSTSTSRSSTWLEKREWVYFDPVCESAFFPFLPSLSSFFPALREPPLDELYSLTVSSNSTSLGSAPLPSY